MQVEYHVHAELHAFLKLPKVCDQRSARKCQPLSGGATTCMLQDKKFQHATGALILQQVPSVPAVVSSLFSCVSVSSHSLNWLQLLVFSQHTPQCSCWRTYTE